MFSELRRTTRYRRPATTFGRAFGSSFLQKRNRFKAIVPVAALYKQSCQLKPKDFKSDPVSGHYRSKNFKAMRPMAIGMDLRRTC